MERAAALFKKATFVMDRGGYDGNRRKGKVKLATNREIKSKEDVIKAAKLYISNFSYISNLILPFCCSKIQ